MKRLFATGSLALAVLLAGCASTDGGEDTFLGFKVEHPDPAMESTRSPG